MSPRSFRKSLWLIPFTVVLAHCSIEFFIGQAYDECSQDSEVIACRNNTDRGGLCAYASDANKLWCCPASDPACWSFAEKCTGGSSASPGPGQISCSSEGAQWCCDKEYESCTETKNQINVCVTNFASGNANVSIAEANAVESASSSASSSTKSPSAVSGTRSPSNSVSGTMTVFSTMTSTPSSASASAGTETSKSSSSLSSGAIAGIVIAVVLAVAIVLGFFVCGKIIRARRRRRPNRETQPIMSAGQPMVPKTDQHYMTSVLDGRGQDLELPGQEIRHELR